MRPSTDPAVAVPGSPRATAHAKNAFIQGARGLFCLMVFVYHVHNSGLGTLDILRTPPAVFLFGTLEFGVELFFGISGIVIIGSLQRSPSVRAFLWNRATRILPVLWATIGGVLLVALVFHTSKPSGIDIIASMLPPLPLLGTDHVNPIAWTLDFEMAFYFLCSGVVYFGARNRLGLAIIAVAALGLLVYPRTLMMLAGTLIALNWVRGPLVDRLVRHTLLMLVIYLFAWRGLVVWVGTSDVHLMAPLHMPTFDDGLWLAVAMVLATAFGTVALLGIAQGRGPLGLMLGSPIFVKLGNISYSFYLWHIPVMAGVKRFIQGSGVGHAEYAQALLFAVSFPIACAVAFASYSLIELRLSSWLRRSASLSLAPRRDKEIVANE